MTTSKSLLEHKALELLDSYSGANNYIIYLKNKKDSSKKFFPTRTQADYIINYFKQNGYDITENTKLSEIIVV